VPAEFAALRTGSDGGDDRVGAIRARNRGQLMSSEHLREFFAQKTKRQLLEWVENQLAKISGLRRVARRHARVSNELLPQPEAVVNETIRHILCDHEGYVWDGKGSFDTFFDRCLIRSAESLRWGERRHRNASNKFVPNTDSFTGAALPSAHELREKQIRHISLEDAKRVLATVIVTRTRPLGRGQLEYMKGLATFAEAKMTSKEIADELKVKESSVNTYRARARGLISKKIEGDD
jgi:hypothetical protein